MTQRFKDRFGGAIGRCVCRAQLLREFRERLGIAFGEDARGVSQHRAKRGGIGFVQTRGESSAVLRRSAEVIAIQRGD